MLKTLNKVLIWVKERIFKGLFKNPLFYYGATSVILFFSIYLSCNIPVNVSLKFNKTTFFNSFFKKPTDKINDLFASKANASAFESPDFKTIEGNTVCAIAPPCVISGKVLGDAFGTTQNQKEIIDYIVQPGDTLQSIADEHNININTIIWANGLARSSSPIKVGQSLLILPTDGVLHIVKSDDTIASIAKTYKAKSEEIISYNDLINEDDIYIEDILVVPGGVMPKKAAPIAVSNNNQVPLADNFFILPTQGKISQGLHYYNAVDIANNCGNLVYAAASGVVQKVRYGWNMGGGNYLTIFHATNGVVTYYGHLRAIFVSSGDYVNVGDKIGLIGNTGKVIGATGCHVHFEVRGSKNPFAKYVVGTWLKY